MTLKPWQPLPAVRCRACGEQAVRSVTATDGEPEFVVEGRALRIEYGPDAVRMRYGGSNSVTLRMTWRYWLTTRLYAVRKRLRLTAREPTP